MCKKYPELEFDPKKLKTSTRMKYIKRFLSLVDLQVKGVKIDTSVESNSLANHHHRNLLNSNKTKFIARNVPVTDDDPFFISLKFPKEAQ